jgi:protein-S-isoprenylcysteine O-methyltransferase Ste14
MKNNKIFNKLVGYSIILSGIAGLILAFTKDALSSVRISIAIINLLVGVLILFRQSVFYSKPDSWKSYWIPALLFNIINLNLSLPLANWSRYPILIFLAGTVITFISLLYLGKSFGIRPALRTVVVRGPYRIVRHPAYFGQCMMATACMMANITIFSVLALMALTSFQVLRIIEEENLLQNSDVYVNYSKHSRWRLIPFVW